MRAGAPAEFDFWLGWHLIRPEYLKLWQKLKADPPKTTEVLRKCPTHAFVGREAGKEEK